MKKRSTVVLALVPLVLGFPDASPACSIRVSLWDAVADADAIIVARVEGVETDPTPGDPSFGQPSRSHEVVVLKILETWKGTLSGEVRLDLSGESAFGYVAGQEILEFLQRGETRARRWSEAIEGVSVAEVDGSEEAPNLETYGWTAEDAAKERARIEQFAGWSAGLWLSTSYWDHRPVPDGADRDALKSLIDQVTSLQAAGAGKDERRDWLVSAAERRVTRSERVFDLPGEALAEEQLSRLAGGFIREPALDHLDVSMLMLLASYPDLEVDRTAASVVEAGLLLRPIPAWVTRMVELTLARYGDRFADRIGRDDVDKEGRPIYTGEGENTLPTIWEVARRELGIPSVAPAQRPE